jgi:type II secretory ATPase GspE/PulE/Tfp pilus assembly ATPase PilB-like protein
VPAPIAPPDSARRPTGKLGTTLVEAGLVTPGDLERALVEQQKRPGKRLGEVLVAMKLVDESDLMRALAARFRLPFVDLDGRSTPEALLERLPVPMLARYRVLPLEDLGDGGLLVAIADPFALDALDAIRMTTGRPTRPALAMPSQLDARLEALAGHAVGGASAADRSDIDSILADLIRTGPPRTIPQSKDVDVDELSDTGVIRLVNQLILDAYRRGASDIHVEPNGDDRPALVRFRVDGECIAYHEIPPAFVLAVVARIKIMADLDIAEHRKPQDGKIQFKVGSVMVELRVATVPTAGGNEDVVMRILPPQKPRPLSEMGLSGRNLREVERLVRMPYGLFLCVGPTGSGKTTTLHSALSMVNTPDVKIWTAEDPVEISQPGLRQVQIHRKVGLDFAAAMRAFLRADPDIIMVGEMRDKETATMAIEASLTGHLVLSTLHTNNAPETITRLLDMGLDPFAFSDSLLGVLAQRLLRTLCPVCVDPYDPSPEEWGIMIEAYEGREPLMRDVGLSEDGDLLLWRGRGCDACGGTGYRGRTAIHELLVVDDEMREAISRRAGMDVLRALAKKSGMRTLLVDGIGKAVLGQTDLRQVVAVCSR